MTKIMFEKLTVKDEGSIYGGKNDPSQGDCADDYFDASCKINQESFPALPDPPAC